MKDGGLCWCIREMNTRFRFVFWMMSGYREVVKRLKSFVFDLGAVALSGVEDGDDEISS